MHMIMFARSSERTFNPMCYTGKLSEDMYLGTSSRSLTDAAQKQMIAQNPLNVLKHMKRINWGKKLLRFPKKYVGLKSIFS